MIDVREEAKGRWRGILPAMGIAADYLTGKHGPCPICKDGKDRFRFDDKDGKGTWFCAAGHDGKQAGDGVKLVMLATGLEFKAAAARIREHIGTAPIVPSRPRRDPERVRLQMNTLWRSGLALAAVPEVLAWWARRLGETPSCADLRAVARTPYRDGLDGPLSFHAAMLALVRDATGKPVDLHRTFLATGGVKAAVREARKTTAVSLPHGSAVRLSDPTDQLGIAEGLETAAAAALLFSLPVWAALNASNLERWNPPEGVRSVMVLGDNDAAKRFTGQRAAYALADRLAGQGLRVTVLIPPDPGDWNDVWMREMANGTATTDTPSSRTAA